MAVISYIMSSREAVGEISYGGVGGCSPACAHLSRGTKLQLEKFNAPVRTLKPKKSAGSRTPQGVPEPGAVERDGRGLVVLARRWTWENNMC
jgi:hypothetical protein